jgi:hypothetical protein
MFKYLLAAIICCTVSFSVQAQTSEDCTTSALLRANRNVSRSESSCKLAGRRVDTYVKAKARIKPPSASVCKISSRCKTATDNYKKRLASADDKIKKYQDIKTTACNLSTSSKSNYESLVQRCASQTQTNANCQDVCTTQSDSYKTCTRNCIENNQCFTYMQHFFSKESDAQAKLTEVRNAGWARLFFGEVDGFYQFNVRRTCR